MQLARVLHHVHGVKLNELAILTPYSAQKETIKKLAAEAKLLNESPSDTIKVASITESQGSYIIYRTTLSSYICCAAFQAN